MKANVTNTLYVDFSDITHFFTDIQMAAILTEGYFRYEPYLKKAIHNFMFKLYPETKETDIFFLSIYEIKTEYKYFYLIFTKLTQNILFYQN